MNDSGMLGSRRQGFKTTEKRKEEVEFGSSLHETVIKLLTLHNESVALFQINHDDHQRKNGLDLIWANQSFEKTFFLDSQVTEDVFLKQFFQEAGTPETSKHYCLYELMVMFRIKCKLNLVKSNQSFYRVVP